jgi:hypothetical protein
MWRRVVKNILNVKIVGALALAGVLATSAISRANDERATDWDGDRARVKSGYEIAPVPLDTRGKNRVLIGLGSYIVNAQSSCNDCHTHPSFVPGGDPYQGQPEVINTEQYLAGGRLFGPFKSPNITPDAHGRPAGLTFPEFLEAIRSGHDSDGSARILQVMPWTTFRHMTDRDLRAIYEYLRAIPARPDNPNVGP